MIMKMIMQMIMLSVGADEVQKLVPALMKRRTLRWHNRWILGSY